MRILYVTTIGLTMGFFKNLIKSLMDEGHTVDIACNERDYAVPACYREWGCTVYPLSCGRNPFSKGTIVAIGELRMLAGEQKYDIVHCHTPVAAMCTRLACRRARKQGTKVFYTAHGFHFYKGAPLLNWLAYYPVEKLCAHFTDVLITINQEDYLLARKKLKAKRVVYVPGVGIDVAYFKNAETDPLAKRKELGIPEDATLLFSVGELSARKNHQLIIRGMARLKDPALHYMIAGEGERLESLRALAKETGLEEKIHFLGYRTDVRELYHVADLFCFPSYQEGLPVSVMEAMASALPVACSKIRGNVDIVDPCGGAYFDPFDADSCADALRKLLEADRESMIAYNSEKIMDFDVRNIIRLTRALYGMSECSNCSGS